MLAYGMRGALAAEPRKRTDSPSVKMRFRARVSETKPLPGTHAARPMVFGGKVLEVQPDQHWFVMNGGNSRKYARVRILHNAKTRWAGVSLSGRALRLGEPVQVTASVEGEAFRASIVVVLDPHAKPGGSGAAPR